MNTNAEENALFVKNSTGYEWTEFELLLSGNDPTDPHCYLVCMKKFPQGVMLIEDVKISYQLASALLALGVPTRTLPVSFKAKIKSFIKRITTKK